MSEAFKPSVSLLVKLGSVAVHVEEYLSPAGHGADHDAINSLLGDPEVLAWLAEMNSLALLPLKRSGGRP